MDKDWRDSRIPGLEIIVLCLGGVELKYVSWAVRYLDKPQLRAVALARTIYGV